MSRFFERNCRPYFKTDKLISLKISPKKIISKNIVVLYKITFLKNKKIFQRNVWGKTMGKNQFRLLNFLSQSGVSRYLPNYFGYMASLNFSLSEEVSGKAVRNLEKDFYFWKRNIAKFSQILFDFQELKIPNSLLKTYTKDEERRFVRDSFTKIKRYSSSVWKKYRVLENFYLEKLFSRCWKENFFSFSHFDFQPSNIFYDKKEKAIKVLDFDLSRNFHPALDLANFWVHFYLMSRYHFSKRKALFLCDKLLQGFLEKSQKKNFAPFRNGKFLTGFSVCFDVLKLRAVIDIAQITASAFKKPCQKSLKVFEKLNEILKLISV